MNIHDLLVKRRSIRKYTDRKLSPEAVKMILEAALLCPTSKSARAWQLVVVEDHDTLTRLADCKPAGAISVGRCPFAVVVTVDSTKSEAWIEDASVAAFAMQLQAADLGIGSCWVQVRGRNTADGATSDEHVRGVLDIPDDCPVLCIVTFGYPDEERKPQDTEKLKWENIHIDRW